MVAEPDRIVTRPEEVAARVLDLGTVGIARGALGDSDRAWVVGGAVRDAALGLRPRELDLAVADPPGEIARAIARHAGGHALELSSEHGTWRVVPRGGGGWQVDITGLRAPGIEADLADRDFTVGAMAVPLGGDPSAGGQLLDPHGGLRDLERGVLRVVSEQSFGRDPLRLLRAARIASSLGLEVDQDTVGAARARSHRSAEPAAERILEELGLMMGGSDPVRGVRLLERIGWLAEVIPELIEMQGVTQGPNHHLDVYEHSLAVLEGVIEIEQDPGAVLTAERLSGEAEAGEVAAEVGGHLARPLANGMTRAVGLRLGALLHDIGKPATRTVRDGHIGFPGHDRTGAELIGRISRRLAMSSRLAEYLASIARHHLVLGFMAARGEPGDREVHDYLRATGDVSVDVTLLTVADRLAARGAGSLAGSEMVSSHLQVAATIVARGLAWRREGPPAPLLAGDEIAAALGLEPGPVLGKLVAELEAAQYAGEVDTRDEAVEHLRRYLSS